MMAEEKKNSTAEENLEAQLTASEAVSEAEVVAIDTDASVAVETAEEDLTISDKLKEAAGSIKRMNADSRARKSEQEKNLKKSEDEAKARIEEAEKQRQESERIAQLVAEQKLAALDYAENYRKKLQQDKERAVSAQKKREIEERQAEEAKAKEQKAKEIAEHLEKEKEEAKARGDRASELLSRVTKCAVVDDEGNLRVVDKAEAESLESIVAKEEPVVKEAPVSPAPTPAVEKKESAPKADESLEKKAEREVREFLEGSDDYDEGDKLILNLSDERMIIEIGDKEEPEIESVIIPEGAKTAGEALAEEVELIRRQRMELEEICELHRNMLESSTAVETEPEVVPAEEETVADEAYIEPVVMDDPRVISVLAFGERVDSLKVFKKYLRASDSAVAYFEKQVSKCDKEMARNVDENDAPAIIAEMLVHRAKILEIRCDNLAVATRIAARKQAKRLAKSLSKDIDNYNEKGIEYFDLTGEQLTRVSAFLPQQIKDNAGVAVIPALSYRESYIEVFVEGDEAMKADSVSTTVIAPPYTASELLPDCEIETAGDAKAYRAKAAKADAKLESSIRKLRQSISHNVKTDASNKKKALIAREKLDRALSELESRCGNSYRQTEEYQKKVDAINKKYGKRVVKAEAKIENASIDRKNLKLLVECFAIESEKLEVACKLLRKIRIVASGKTLSAVKAEFIDKMLVYNSRADECAEAIGSPVAKIAASLVDEVARTGSEVLFPKIAYRRELVETVGEDTRIVGDRLRSEFIPELENEEELTVADKHNDAFADDKSTGDKALAIEQILLDAVKAEAENVSTKKEFGRYRRHSGKVLRKLRASIRQTERGIIKAADENVVISNLVENLRIRGKLVELYAVRVATAARLHLTGKARKDKNVLYNEVELYNARALDYSAVTGEQITRISAFLPEAIADRSAEVVIPTLSYKENYIEVFSKKSASELAGYDNLLETRRGGEYSPVIFTNRRLTDNKAVSTTPVNAPCSSEDILSFDAPTSYYERMCNDLAVLYVHRRLNRRLAKIKRSLKKLDKQSVKFDKRYATIAKAYDKQIFAIESVTSDDQRQTAEYRNKLQKANRRFTIKSIKLKLKRARAAIERRRMKLIVERLAIEREYLAISCKNLRNLRNYGRPRVLAAAKNELIRMMTRYNLAADACSLVIGEPIARISASYADDIIKSGKEFRLPKLVCCREIIETVDDKSRTVGEKFRYSMLGVKPLVTPIRVGAPMFNAGADSVPTFGIDANGTPIIGAANAASPYSAFNAPASAEQTDATAASDAITLATLNAYAALGATTVADDKSEQTDFVHDTLLNSELAAIDKYAVGAAKAKSKTVLTRKAYRRYKRRSKKLIARLEKLLKVQKRAIVKSNDDKQTALETLVAIATLGKIVEIRCADLYAAAKVGVRRYVNKTRKDLADDIDSYNSYVSEYSALTKEKLTPISTLIPDKLAKKEASAVIPSILYSEKFAEEKEKEEAPAGYTLVLPDIESIKAGAAATATTTKPTVTVNDMTVVTAVSAPATVDSLLENLDVQNEKKLKQYLKAVAKTDRHFDRLILKNEKKKEKQAKRDRRRRKKLYKATRRYDRAVLAVSRKSRSAAKYQRKLRRVTKRYRNRIFRIEKRYPAISLLESRRLHLEIFALEQEKLMLAATALLKAVEIRSRKKTRVLKDAFIDAMTRYNIAAERISALLQVKVSGIDPTALDDIVIDGKLPTLAKIIHEKNIVEVVGDTRNVIGEREVSTSESCTIVFGAGAPVASVSTVEAEPEEPVAPTSTQIATNVLALDDIAEKQAAEELKKLNQNELKKHLNDSVKEINNTTKKLAKLSKKKNKAPTIKKPELIIACMALAKEVIDKICENMVAAVSVREMRVADNLAAHLMPAIADYNKLAYEFANITGESLTVASERIPEDILAGRSYQILPILTYNSYAFERKNAVCYSKEDAEIRLRQMREEIRKDGIIKDAALEAKVAEQANKDLSVITKYIDFEISMLESARDIEKFRFGKETVEVRKSKKQIAKEIAHLKKANQVALKYEQADNDRYYSVVMTDPEFVQTKKKRVNRIKLDSLRSRLIVLLNKRDEINSKLSSLYTGTEVNLDGSSVNQKWRHVKNAAAEAAIRKDMKLAKRVSKLPASEGEKQRIYTLMNKRLDAKSTLELCKYRLKKENNTVRVRRDLKEDIKMSKRIIKQCTADINWMMKRFRGRYAEAGGSWITGFGIIFLVIVAAVVGYFWLFGQDLVEIINKLMGK